MDLTSARRAPHAFAADFVSASNSSLDAFVSSGNGVSVQKPDKLNPSHVQQ